MNITTDTDLTLEVVGKRPTNQPYLRITDADGEYIGSLDEADMRALRDAIAAGHRVVIGPDGVEGRVVGYEHGTGRPVTQSLEVEP